MNQVETEMQNFQFTEKEQVFYRKYIGNFDTPKKLNRSTKNVSQELVNSIEEGSVNSTQIKEAAQKVPVFTYKTCLTFHGNFPAMTTDRIGGYKNVIQNKNGSLEIRYSAIDYQQKNLIRKYIGYGNAWHSKENSSTGIYFEKSKTADTRAEAIKILNQLQTEAQNFNIQGMKAEVYAAGYNVWGRYYLVLSVKPLMITGDPLTIASQLTGEAAEAIINRIATAEKEAEEEKQKRQAEREAREKAKEQAAAALNFVKQKIQPTPGAVYIAPVNLTTGGAGYRFFKVETKGSFGRFTLKSYVSKDTVYNPEKLSEYRNGKQMKASDIIQETYLYR